MSNDHRNNFFAITETLDAMSNDPKMSKHEKEVLTVVVADRKEHAWCELCFEIVRSENGSCKDCGCGVGYLDPYDDPLAAVKDC